MGDQRLEIPTHLRQPVPPLDVVGQHSPQQAPEPRGVMGFAEVNQLVGNDVFDEGRGEGHDLPVQVEPAVPPAAPPSVAKVLDLHGGGLHTNLSRKALDSCAKPDLSEPDIPSS